MSTADPLLPVPDPDGAPDADVLPDDDRLELERADDVPAARDEDGTSGDPARPAAFVTPAAGDRLGTDELRRDLGAD
jgi:hypothetical protein